MSFFQQILAFNKPNNSNNEIIIGNHNIDAYNFINLFPNWNNNLVIFQGPYGCGKNRILKFWQNNSSAIQLDLFKNDTKKICQDLEKHMHFFIKDLDHYFNKKYILRNLTLNNVENYENILFLILDHVITQKKFLVFSSQISPTNFNIKLNDLSSRLNAIPIITFNQPDDQTLKTFLIAELVSRQININKDICDFILKKSTRSFTYISQLVNKIDKVSLESKSKITKAFITDIINKEL